MQRIQPVEQLRREVSSRRLDVNRLGRTRKEPGLGVTPAAAARPLLQELSQKELILRRKCSDLDEQDRTGLWQLRERPRARRQRDVIRFEHDEGQGATFAPVVNEAGYQSSKSVRASRDQDVEV